MMTWSRQNLILLCLRKFSYLNYSKKGKAKNKQKRKIFLANTWMNCPTSLYLADHAPLFTPDFTVLSRARSGPWSPSHWLVTVMALSGMALFSRPRAPSWQSGFGFGGGDPRVRAEMNLETTEINHQSHSTWARCVPHSAFSPGPWPARPRYENQERGWKCRMEGLSAGNSKWNKTEASTSSSSNALAATSPKRQPVNHLACKSTHVLAFLHLQQQR